MTYTQTYNAENQLVSITANPSGQTTTFVYDGDGNLVKKIKPDGSKTIYVGGVYEIDKTSGGSTQRTLTYYPMAGAMRIDGTLYYVLKDHLGSASVVTDAGGNVVGEQRYYPFGEARLTTGTLYTDRLFTGQREMAGLGVYHYGARFYSPKLGRFLSADTIVPGYANPQNLNRYSYVRNSPLVYTDPSGHRETRCTEGTVCKPEGPTNGGGHDPDPDEEDDEGGGGHDLNPEDELDGGSAGHHAMMDAYFLFDGGSGFGGDENIGYEIRYDVGVVLIHYNGQHIVVNLQEIKKDPMASLALTEFIKNADNRVSALRAIKSAQRDLFVSAGVTLLGGGLTAWGVVTTGGSLGTLTLLGAGEIVLGIGMMAVGGVDVYNSGMAWGEAIEDNVTAESNLSSAWSVLNALP